MNKEEQQLKKSIAYYADELRDAWLNIGKHQPDIKVTDIWNWATLKHQVGDGR